MLTDIFAKVIFILATHIYLIILLFLAFILGLISIIYGLTIKKSNRKKIFIITGLLGILPFIICISLNIFNHISEEIRLDRNLTYNLVQGSLEDVENILKQGIGPECYAKNKKENVLAKDGEQTSLHYLCSINNVPQQCEKLKLLIDYGADVNSITYSCEKSQEEHKFIGYNDKCGETPLMKACYIGNLEVVKILLENGADVNAREFSGRTALHHTVFYNELESDENTQIEIIKILLEYGIDKNIEGYYHGTALDCAKEYKLDNFISLLK